jgi:hypothetical protein
LGLSSVIFVVFLAGASLKIKLDKPKHRWYSNNIMKNTNTNEQVDKMLDELSLPYGVPFDSLDILSADKVIAEAATRFNLKLVDGQRS